ncbi:type VII secretion protein EccB [Streptomyces sp. cf386]|uniref:type VII secretion protein EccB n=1 Tax=Streptomyces sp. cf386 TaxID=1761904 RepID=UPI0008910777|nr:type VII secretion protein EccB [Streptomyces sp. cf386]SDM43830.1 type VII secretion protein EccB [Streptomyces sp. cf386]
MQTRRDQVQAYTFTLSRITAGLTRGEPDAPEVPMRRFTFGTIAGTALGVVALGGMAAYGFLFPGSSKAFQKEGTLVVEKETGARYLYLSGALHPVLNTSSAIMITGQGNLKPQTVAAKAVRSVPKGPVLGIPGAPDSLPEAKSLDRDKWSVCTANRTKADGSDEAIVTAYIGGGNEKFTELGADRALQIEAADGTNYLAWSGVRLKVDGEATLTALGYANTPAFKVPDAWLNSLASGPDLTAPDVPGRGSAGPPVGGQNGVVGQIFQDDADPDINFLLLADGLSPITATEAALLLGDPATAEAYPGGQVTPVKVPTAALNAAPRSARELRTEGLPTTPPAPFVAPGNGNQVPCVRVTPGTGAGDKPKVTVAVREAAGGTADAAPPGLPRPEQPATDGPTADRIVVAPGHGTLATATGAGAAPTLFLITDSGVRFPLANPEVATSLGYDPASAVPVPSTVLSLVPTGPALDPEIAKSPLAADPGKAPAAPVPSQNPAVD